MIEQVRQSSLFENGLGGHSRVASSSATEAVGADFTSMISRMAKQSVDVLREGEQAAAAGIRGHAPIQEVVDKVMAAEQSLQAALAVRDKVVSAWLEISRINI